MVLEYEWQRCVSLLGMMPKNIQSIVFDGFREELTQRELNDEIRSFLTDKFKR